MIKSISCTVLFLLFFALAGAQPRANQDEQVFTVAKPNAAELKLKKGYSIVIGNKEFVGILDSLPLESGEVTTQSDVLKYEVLNLFSKLDSAYLKELKSGKQCRIISFDYVVVVANEMFKGNSKVRSGIAPTVLGMLKPKDMVFIENINLDGANFIPPKTFVIHVR